MADCLLCGFDRAVCSCFADDPQVDERPRHQDRELAALAILDATDVLAGVPGIPGFL